MARQQRRADDRRRDCVAGSSRETARPSPRFVVSQVRYFIMRRSGDAMSDINALTPPYAADEAARAAGQRVIDGRRHVLRRLADESAPETLAEVAAEVIQVFRYRNETQEGCA